MKDHFYSSDPDNPFYHTEILHLSLSEDSRLIKKSLQYYKENKIPFANWGDIPTVTKKEMVLMSFFFVKKYLTTVRKEFDLYLLDSWDGNIGPDIWELFFAGNAEIHTTFSNRFD